MGRLHNPPLDEPMTSKNTGRVLYPLSYGELMESEAIY